MRTRVHGADEPRLRRDRKRATGLADDDPAERRRQGRGGEHGCGADHRDEHELLHGDSLLGVGYS